MYVGKALVIAPHPDDEINLAGQLMLSLKKKGADIFVVYTTNGDATAKEGNRRMREAVNALEVLGVERKHIIFLGYANEWKGNRHLYNCGEQEEICSRLGKTKTNGTEECAEYCFLKKGIHHAFTRYNFKSDMKAALEEIRADLLICVDYDRHPDHRAASLIFEEVMGEILKENPDYRPVVLKKYAYNGVWGGEKDYYRIPFQPTRNRGKFEYAGTVHELESPNFLWKERLSFETPEETRTTLLSRNILYKAARKHKSTTAWYMAQRVINADAVYWWRPTENLVFNADLEASSGDAAYVNDFKMYDSGDVLEQEEPFEKKEFCWRPTDDSKTLRIHFAREVQIKEINIYEDCHARNHIKNLVMRIGKQVIYCEPCNDGANTRIVLEQKLKTDVLELQITEWTGSPGISEIEIFSEVQDFRQLGFPLKEYAGVSAEKGRLSLGQKLERFWFRVLFFFTFIIKDEINKRRRSS